MLHAKETYKVRLFIEDILIQITAVLKNYCIPFKTTQQGIISGMRQFGGAVSAVGQFGVRLML